LENNADKPEAVLQKVAEMEASLDEVMKNLHRVAMALRPASLDHLGLVAALRQHVESVGARHGINITFKEMGIKERLPDNVETVLYRIAQEALTNVVRHAGASQVDVILTVRNEKLVLIIEDDGNGFDPEATPSEGHLGLFGMRERAQMIDGNLVIESAAGRGTTIIVEVNYANPFVDR
jgi:signal transduction histidine kinase